MAINPISFDIKGIQEIAKPQPLDKASGIEQGKDSFSQMFSNAIKEVDDLQKTADNQIEGLTVGAPGVTTHGAMLALEKADIAFQLMSAVRAKIVRAYEEVLRTQI